MKINQPAFLAIIAGLCAKHSASVTSWIRTPKRNTRAGGRPDSRHLLGMACDVVPDDWRSGPAIMNEARALGLDAVNEGDHIHIEADKRTD